MIPDLTIGDVTIDCANAERARDFYANLMGWEKTTAFGALAVKTDNGMTILFWEPDISYVPPVWPEEPGKQQKQMHLDFVVDKLRPSVKRATRLGATKAAKQYGGKEYVTMFDPEGHPFCLCKGKSKSPLGISGPHINIDCQKYETLLAFYAKLTPWEQPNEYLLLADHGLTVHCMGCDGDFDYIPPVWPEESGKQQKQMHFNFQVDDLQTAVEEAIRLGATKAANQYGGEHFVTLLDTEGHPFCLCKR